MKVNVNDIIDIYEKEVSVNTKNKSKVYNFEKNKIENIYDIKNIIESDNYKITKYNVFTINNPKYRMVMSLNMKDKIINHYVARFILLPKLNKYLDIRNCATRKNMGYDYAIKLLKRYIECNKKYGKFYILKIDISKYFYSIDHNILKELLKDKLNEEEYKIVSRIIDSTNESYINKIIINIKNNLLIKDKNRCNEINKLPLYEYNKGLPIGNMTSQILSIFYLYKLDHYIIHNLNLKYMVRYMDDYIIISNDKNKLKKALKEIEYILNKKYKLNINKNNGRFGMLIVSGIIVWVICELPFIGRIVSFVIAVLGLGILVSAILPKKSCKKNKDQKVSDSSSKEEVIEITSETKNDDKEEK